MPDRLFAIAPPVAGRLPVVDAEFPEKVLLVTLIASEALKIAPPVAWLTLEDEEALLFEKVELITFNVK
jgi:hypothetical protein